MIQAGSHLKKALLALGDATAFQLALALTLFIRYGALDAWHWSLHALPFGILTILWIMGFYVAGLYDLTLIREPLKLFRTYLEAMIANLGLAIGLFYLIPAFGIAPRTNLFLHFAFALLLGYGWRVVYTRGLFARFSPGRVLYLGSAEDAAAVQALLQRSSLGFELAVAIPTEGTPHQKLPIIWEKDVTALDTIVRHHAITAVVVGSQADAKEDVKNALYRTLFTNVAILDRAELEEVTTGRIPLTHVSETWFLHHLREAEKAWYDGIKRLVDLLLALPFGVLTLALYPIVALGIKLSSPGPVLYSQVRVGKGGLPFRIWKFRTMHTDAEKAGAQFTKDAKTDPRLFAVGRFLRQTRIDELPQIWNVLHGDLSFIGPRPERPEFVEPLIERMPYYALRHLARPGLTGWAQVMFLTPTASLDDNLKKLQYDLYYIKHRSPLLDLAILLKTIGIVLRRQGT